jgi:NAD(P)-dependent dehydrogenase (short-subunit alcohol dehydrogenase family)
MPMKVAFVTGAGSGIGRGVALSLASAGYDVAISYASSRRGAEDIADQIRGLGQRSSVYQLDVRNVSLIRSIFSKIVEDYGQIDLLVNNAGVTKRSHFLQTDEALFDEIIQTDLKGAYFCAQEAARNMVSKETKGVIVNISSNQAVGCWPESTVYASAKAGLEKLTKNMALDLSPYGIRVVAVAPGYTHRKLKVPILSESQGANSSRIPLKRYGSPQEVGAAIVFLASEAAGYITGTTLFIDGGALLPVVVDNDFT